MLIRLALGSALTAEFRRVAVRRSAPALRPFGRRRARTMVSGPKGWRWPHDPQRSGLAARSAVATVTVPVWPLGAADGP
jgi:hypothetical protein